MNAKRGFFLISMFVTLFAAVSIVISTLPKSYSQNAESYCLDFRQDCDLITDCFISDKLWYDYTDDLAYNVRILVPCHESEKHFS
jgi:hypothetical protein